MKEESRNEKEEEKTNFKMQLLGIGIYTNILLICDLVVRGGVAAVDAVFAAIMDIYSLLCVCVLTM